MSGTVPVATLGRLAEALADTAGELEWSLTGGRDGRGRPQLVLSVSGELRLTCQRCLKPLEFELDAESSLLLLKPGVELPADEEDEMPDAIEASETQDVLALVEDEALLGLPIAPRHERCEPPGGASENQESSPFAALAQLKKH